MQFQVRQSEDDKSKIIFQLLDFVRYHAASQYNVPANTWKTFEESLQKYALENNIRSLDQLIQLGAHKFIALTAYYLGHHSVSNPYLLKNVSLVSDELAGIFLDPNSDFLVWHNFVDSFLIHPIITHDLRDPNNRILPIVTKLARQASFDEYTSFELQQVLLNPIFDQLEYLISPSSRFKDLVQVIQPNDLNKSDFNLIFLNISLINNESVVDQFLDKVKKRIT